MGSALSLRRVISRRESASATDEHVIEIGDGLISAGRRRFEAQRNGLRLEVGQAETPEDRVGSGTRAGGVTGHDLRGRESAEHLRRAAAWNRSDGHGDRTHVTPTDEADD